MTQATQYSPEASPKGSGQATSKFQPRIMRPGPEEINPARFRARRRRIELVLAWVAPIVFLLLWEWCSRAELINPQYFPAPSTVFEKMIEMFQDGIMQENLWITLRRVIYGFALGVISGTAVGIVMGLSRKVRAALDGLLTALYMVPKLAILPLLMMIFGLGETPKILLIAITCFFYMWLTVMAAFISLSPGYDEAARSFGASRWQRFRHVEFPASLPQIFFGLRLTIGVAMLVVVGVEFVQANDGLGWLIWNSWSLLAATQMYAGIIVVAVTGVLLTQIIRVIGKVLLPWATATSDAVIF